MHLGRVEAVRYGELAGTALDGLGPCLTVVLGRNEAGKSTFTSLVRHILYGFPRGRVQERQYLPPTGDHRVGRLVFVEEAERWTVERVEGAHGGSVAVHGPHGEEPAGALLESLTSGVSAATFAAVFGFSLEQLSDVHSLDDMGSRLYATAAGLGADPYEVLGTLRAEADELWAPRARTRVLHSLNSELRELRERRRHVEQTAERYRADRERRAAVAGELDELEEMVVEARRGGDRLTALLAEARRLVERTRESEESAVQHRLAAEALRHDAESADVDEQLLERADRVERLAARCELFRSEVEQLRRDEDLLQDIDRELERLVNELGEGWTLDEALALRLDVDLEDRLHRVEEQLDEARRLREESRRRTAEAEAERDEALAAARESSRALGFADDSGADDEVGVRLQAVERLLAAGGEGVGSAASGVPATGAAMIAAILAAAGFIIGDGWLLMAAVLPAALAIGLLAWPMVRRRRAAPEIEALRRVLGLRSVPSPAELMAIKSGLENCRRLWLVVEQQSRAVEARRRVAEAAASDFECVWGKWSQWLREQRLLAPSDQPDSIRRVLIRLRALRSAADERRKLEAEVVRRRAFADSFVAEAVELGASGPQKSGPDFFDEWWRGARSLQAALGAAREQAAVRSAAEREAKLTEERAEADAARAARASAEMRALLVEAGLGETAGLADLEAAAAAAGRRVRELEAARDDLLEQRGTLDGLLQRGAEESRSAGLRLAEAGIVERVRDALESYAVAAVAAKLLESSLAIYEAERQPLVIQRAQELFARLTGNRYIRLATPLGRFEPAVTAVDRVSKSREKLSRATAEQLFLALRLSYIEHLVGAHPALPLLMDDVLVNFDDGRRQNAVEVISEFAELRQVIFFTCHRATADAFAEATGDHTRIELST